MAGAQEPFGQQNPLPGQWVNWETADWAEESETFTGASSAGPGQGARST
jgi:hypothetical protein